MSIYKINSGLPPQRKFELLNDMIIELYGLVQQGKFDKNELDQFFADDSSIARQFLRNVSLGNTYSTYTGWTHVHAQSGYSVWKLAPSDYSYNVLNALYLDNKVLENRGSANSETLSSFDKVYLHNGSYVDNTTEAATENGTAFDLMADTDDYLYVGSATQFSGVTFEFAIRGSAYEIITEYWNGSAWTELEFSGNTVTDGTNNFRSDGNYTFDIPNNWATVAVNSQTKYWIRFRSDSSVPPTTVATAYLVVPSNSVISLLTLSSEEFFKENWAWCSYNGYIYVTIRNTGVSAYEGSYFITSSSSETNKQNFFVANHQFTSDYEDINY